jgi:competence protein ComEC
VSPSSGTASLLPFAVEGDGPQTRFRAPLAWILFALLPGYLLAEFGPTVPPLALVCAGLALPAGALAVRHMGSWLVFFFSGVVFLAWAWADVRQTVAPPEWDYLPPREVVAECRVVEMFSSSVYPDRQYALIEFVGVDPVVAELAGQRAFASLLLDAQHPPLETGAHYQLRGALYRVDETDEADFARFLRHSGAFFQLRQAWAVAEVRPPPFWLRPLASLRTHWAHWLADSPEERSGQARLLGAMILGERQLLSEEQKTAFLLSGTMHLFAISGLHVMVVALTLQLMVQLLPLPRRLAFAVVLGLLVLYVGATGFSPSAVRAFSMIAFYWLAGVLGRSPRPLPAVMGSAVVVLLFAPAQLFSIGFQLSYSVVLSILLLGLPLAESILRRWPLFTFVLEDERSLTQRFVLASRQRIVESFCISFSATLGSAPLIVLHFGVWTPGAILLNMVLVPMASIVVAVGVFIILCNTLHLFVAGSFFAHGAWLVLIAMEWMVHLAERVPGAYGERTWLNAPVAHSVLLVFLGSLFFLHEPALTQRLRPCVRFGLPAIWMLGSLWLLSTPA